MAPLISPLFLLQGIATVSLAVGAVVLWQLGKRPLWSAVGWGVLSWAISAALKLTVASPTMTFIQHHPDNPLTWLYGGALTGVFECAIPLWLAAKTQLRRADWNQAVAFGIGFGGTEAFLMGLVGLVMALLLVVFPNHIPASARDALLKQFAHRSLASIPLPVVERVTAMVIHCLASVLLIYAVQRRQQRWFWLSFAYKTAVDAFTGWALLAWKMTSSTMKIAEFEAMVSVFALVAIWALPKLKTGFDRSRVELQPGTCSSPPSGAAM
jgi:uncharacterized membrane protein YhfC